MYMYNPVMETRQMQATTPEHVHQKQRGERVGREKMRQRREGGRGGKG